MRPDYFSTRSLAIRLLGGKCACGVTDKDLLTLDHIHGDGTQARRRWHERSVRRGKGSGKSNDIPPSARMKELQRAIDGGYLAEKYQVLCWNCHHKKTRANNDYKPKICYAQNEELPLFGKVRRAIKPVDIPAPVKPTIEWEKQPRLASSTFTKQDEFEWGT